MHTASFGSCTPLEKFLAPLLISSAGDVPRSLPYESGDSSGYISVFGCDVDLITGIIKKLKAAQKVMARALLRVSGTFYCCIIF